LAWKDDWKADADGRVTLGCCKKGADLEKLLHNFDFVICLNRDIWSSDMMNDEQKRAVLDHELSHAEVKRDQTNAIIKNKDGRIAYRMRKHNLEEFREVVERNGCYKADVIDFVKTAMQSKNAPLFDENATMELVDPKTGEVKATKKLSA
jgi:hypothetical protein